MRNTIPRPPLFANLSEMEQHFWRKDDPLAAGPQGPQGPQGPRGPEGPVGQAVRIRWTVATALDLPAINVDVGDGALVGTTGSYVLYVYVNDPPAWVNAGAVTAGPKGDQGDPGIQGPPGATPPLAGTGVATTAARSDHNHNATYSLLGHDHDADYAAVNHDHAGEYSPVSHVHTLSDMSGAITESQMPSSFSAWFIVRDGTIGNHHIASVAASKVTSGVLAEGRIPNINASKVTSGTLLASVIPNLHASKITTGVFDAARIPKQSLNSTFPNNVTTKAGSSSMRVAPGNTHATLAVLGVGWSIHDTGIRRTTDEAWAYVFVPDWGFCWIPANRI